MRGQPVRITRLYRLKRVQVQLKGGESDEEESELAPYAVDDGVGQDADTLQIVYDSVELNRGLGTGSSGEVEVGSVTEGEDVAAEVDQADEGDGGEDPGRDVRFGAGGGGGDHPEDVEVTRDTKHT